jgi:hypothetical protein
MLDNMGIHDPTLLEIIRLHHQDDGSGTVSSSLAPAQRLAHILQVVDRYAAMISPRESREGRSAAESAKSIVNGVIDEGNDVGQALVRIVGLCPPGTYVQLDDDKVAVVLRRSNQPNQPDVAIVVNDKGHRVRFPSLHHTANGGPTIKAALVASVVQDRINHHVILQLGTQAA